MMDSTKGPDSPSNRSEGLASVDSESLLVVPSTTITAPPNRSLGSRPQRSRKGFASGKSRLSLKIDADCATSGDVVSSTRQSTPASTSSSCSSDVVPWWEVEYQCPPPGHLGAHVVPVSADEQHTDSNNSNVQNTTTRSAAPTLLPSVSVDFSTSSLQTTTSSSQKANAIRAGIVLYETPEGARRGTHSKLSALRSSVPCLLVDSSPSQKRKMRPQDPTDCEVDLFSTPVTKELKRFHESRYFNFFSWYHAEVVSKMYASAISGSSLKKSALPSRVVTPATLVQPLTQIGISQSLRIKPRAADTTAATTLFPATDKSLDEAP
ncbi:hypothetical protein F444_19973 [Phytophthora nicotianae P1976]|uniref:Uncharacterized protein n=1 Tax=Phytophthora nicotianae P1976 TaxID=1317066 RepID=A0A080Z625_PHYNI|nr:hypothetical protein F444_19973 [Phytophthora nicotianae P1976]